MADGNRLSPHANVAASRTLPPGTSAKVINPENRPNQVVWSGQMMPALCKPNPHVPHRPGERRLGIQFGGVQ